MSASTGSTSDALKKINPSQIVDVLTGALSTILGAAGGVFLLVTVMFFFVDGRAGFGPRIAALARTQARAGGVAAAVRQPAPSATSS